MDMYNIASHMIIQSGVKLKHYLKGNSFSSTIMLHFSVNITSLIHQSSFCFSAYRIWTQTSEAANYLNSNLKFSICCLNYSFISSLGVSYMMLCTENYPSVLAFCFLDELQKEFITTYNMMKTNTAVRPYCFIEFGKDLTSFFLDSHT